MQWAIEGGVVILPGEYESIDYGSITLEAGPPIPPCNEQNLFMPGVPIVLGNFHSLAVGDFNGDMTPDIVTASETGDVAELRLGIGGAVYMEPVGIPLGFSGVEDVEASDMNGDGNLDLVVVPAGSDSIVVLFGGGDGSFVQSIAYEARSFPSDVGVADITGDGNPDILALDAGTGEIHVLEFQCVSYPGCTPADVAVPYGELNFSDVGAFVTAWTNMEPLGDIAVPFGQWDASDVLLFLGLYGSGCP